MSSNSRTILFLTSWYPVNENPIHGIFIKNHALALSQFANVVLVYAYSAYEGPFYKVQEKQINENFLELIIKYPKPSFALPGIKEVKQTIKFKKAYNILLSILIEKKIEVKAIQVNIVFPAAIVLSIFKNYFKVKHTIVENWSGYLESDGNYKGFFVKHFTEKCFFGADKIWYVSELQKQAMIKHGLSGNFELIFNTVNTNVFKPSIKTNDSKKIKLLHVSSLVEREKNISGTLRVVHQLQKKGYDFEFIIVGGDEQTISAAKQTVNQLKVINLIFTGSLTPEKISELMQQCNALVLFSFFEGMPVVALEALSCGIPVIATKVGYLPNLITEHFGNLVEVANEEQMLTSLENLFLNRYKFNSEKMREFILKNASYEAVGKQFFTFYESC